MMHYKSYYFKSHIAIESKNIGIITYNSRNSLLTPKSVTENCKFIL